MGLETLNYERSRDCSTIRCALWTAVISALTLTTLPLVFVVYDWIVDRSMPLLAQHRTTQIALVASLGLIHITSRLVLSPRGWAIKYFLLMALIPVVALATTAVNRLVWHDDFSTQREGVKRVSGAAMVGAIGLFILLHGATSDFFRAKAVTSKTGEESEESEKGQERSGIS
jgi:hypothetical protein